MKKSKGLQKLTDTNNVIQKLLALETVTMDDIEELSPEQRQLVETVLRQRLDNLAGIERDKFLNQIEPIIEESTKNQIWENNHSQIIWAMHSLINEHNRMPTQTEISKKAELSRQTINKHLKDFQKHPCYLDQVNELRLLGNNLAAKVYNLACGGDVSAAKLFFNLIGSLNKNSDTIKNQNNFIQINGTVLSQDAIKELNPEQLNTIESILKNALLTK